MIYTFLFKACTYLIYLKYVSTKNSQADLGVYNFIHKRIFLNAYCFASKLFVKIHL